MEKRDQETEFGILSTFSGPDLKTMVFTRVFSAAHRLQDHRGNCRRIHGHNYKITTTISADALTSDGMIIEWATVKHFVDEFDHRLILEDSDPLVTFFEKEIDSDFLMIVDVAPTTENLSQVFADTILKAVQYENSKATYIRVDVTLQETESISASMSSTYDKEMEDEERRLEQAQISERVARSGAAFIQSPVLRSL